MSVCYWIPRAGQPIYGACTLCGHAVLLHSTIDVRPCVACAMQDASERMADAVLPVLAAGVKQQTQILREGAHTPARGIPAHRLEVENGPIGPLTHSPTTVYRIDGYKVTWPVFDRVAAGGTFDPRTDALDFAGDHRPE